MELNAHHYIEQGWRNPGVVYVEVFNGPPIAQVISAHHANIVSH